MSNFQSIEKFNLFFEQFPEAKAKSLNSEELNFVFENMYFSKAKHHHSIIGLLPYKSDDERRITDSIVYKLNLRKFFRGPRPWRYASSTHKKDAPAVALYFK